MDNGFDLLTEKEAMWAKMLMEVLTDNGIPCVEVPRYGAGFVMRTGIQEVLRVCVPADRLEQSQALMEALFSEDAIVE